MQHEEIPALCGVKGTFDSANKHKQDSARWVTERVIAGTLVLLIMMTSNADAGKSVTPDSSTIEVGETKPSAFGQTTSDLLTIEERKAVRRHMEQQDEFRKTCPFDLYKNTRVMRECLAANKFSAFVAKHKNRYNVRIESELIAGVHAEIVTPSEGVHPRNRNRVLINLHGSAFMAGSAHDIGQIESIPIAALGKIKIVSVDYRLAPEHTFPAASEDVAAVYRELLRDYKPESMGIFGCSAGALLTAQTVAWLQKERLPSPGAIGMFCAGASYWTEGDSPGLFGLRQLPVENPYFRHANPNDPLVFPLRSAQVIAKFPPSLLITGTRDFALSSVVHTHSRLVQQGVVADLHVWEGLGHAFFFDPDLPQSNEVYEVTVRFFDKHLSKQ